jgi:hypothetical protein
MLIGAVLPQVCEGWASYTNNSWRPNSDIKLAEVETDAPRRQKAQESCDLATMEQMAELLLCHTTILLLADQTLPNLDVWYKSLPKLLTSRRKCRNVNALKTSQTKRAVFKDGLYKALKHQAQAYDPNFLSRVWIADTLNEEGVQSFTKSQRRAGKGPKRVAVAVSQDKFAERKLRSDRKHDPTEGVLDTFTAEHRPHHESTIDLDIKATDELAQEDTAANVDDDVDVHADESEEGGELDWDEPEWKQNQTTTEATDQVNSVQEYAPA